MRLAGRKETNVTDNRKSTLAKIKALLAKTTENGCTEDEAMAALDKAREMMDNRNLFRTNVPWMEGEFQPDSVM
jgi:hypothetical protein